jgi:tetratricopeptide (TPR) repeat protein
MPTSEADELPRWRHRLVTWANRGGRLMATFGALWLIRGVVGLRWMIFPSSTLGLILFASAGLNLYLMLELALYLRPHPPRSLSFEEALLERVEEMFRREDYAAIVRYHATFSRMLWFVGSVRELQRLGEKSEDAAARFGDEPTQAAALIDDLGWCMVVLGEYAEAERNIRHGLQVAEQAGDYYLQAKAHRHLAGLAIECPPRDLVTAEMELETAEAIAQQITDETPRREMLAGVRFARAVLRLFQGRLDEALAMVSEAAGVADPGRNVHRHALRGKIYEAKGDYQLAKDNYRRGYEQAKRVRRTDEEIRNLVGLARVLRAEGRHDESAQLQKLADEMLSRTPVAYELSQEEFDELRRSATTNVQSLGDRHRRNSRLGARTPAVEKPPKLVEKDITGL